MEIKDEAQTVDILFSGSRRQYKIPIYQRRYVWNEKNWDNLWTDVKHRSSNGLFTGIIVTRLQDDSGDLEIYDVIDGQQRLTTFQIILCVIRDICHSIGHTAKGDEADLLIQVGGRHKLHLKEGSDAEAFRSLVNSGTQNDHVIHQAYKHFKDLIAGYTSTEIDDLYAAITRGVNVAQINLIGGDVSEKIFASLNATGRMLSEFDYLRNDLFLRAGKRGPSFYGSNSHWHPGFETDKPSNLDTFLRDFLKANLGPNCFEDEMKPFELYQQDYKASLTPDVEGEFEQLSAYAEFCKEMNDPTSAIGCHMQFYKDLNIPRLDPFILFAKHKLTFVEDLPEVCNVLESYIVRHMLCNGRHIESYEKISTFFEVYKGRKFTASTFKNFLLDTWPDDHRIEVALQSIGSQSTHTHLILYVLYRIESLTNALRFEDLVNLELKRVMPSKYTPTWDREDWSEAKFFDAIDSIGNIALVPSASSASWPELSFADKQQILGIGVPARFAINNVICGSLHWDQGQIERTTQNLLSAFSGIWLR